MNPLVNIREFKACNIMMLELMITQLSKMQRLVKL
jgi:hypothetical protein